MGAAVPIRSRRLIGGSDSIGLGRSFLSIFLVVCVPPFGSTFLLRPRFCPLFVRRFPYIFFESCCGTRLGPIFRAARPGVKKRRLFQCLFDQLKTTRFAREVSQKSRLCFFFMGFIVRNGGLNVCYFCGAALISQSAGKASTFFRTFFRARFFCVFARVVLQKLIFDVFAAVL